MSETEEQGVDTNEMREIARILDNGEPDYLYQRASKALIDAANEIEQAQAEHLCGPICGMSTFTPSDILDDPTVVGPPETWEEDE